MVALVAVTVGVAACGSKSGSSGNATPADTIVGAGATFPYPLYSQWGADYAALSGVKLNYQSIGSGGGISAIEAKTVDFGASDAPLTEADLQDQRSGAVPDGRRRRRARRQPAGRRRTAQLKLTPDVLAKIYMGKITMWNDPAIKAVNPGVTLPATNDQRRAPLRRLRHDLDLHALPDRRGRQHLDGGRRQGVTWPVGVGGKGNEGVAASVKQLSGVDRLRRVRLRQADRHDQTQLQNKDGELVKPSLAGIRRGGRAAPTGRPPARACTALVNQPGPRTWPITGASFILVQKDQQDAARAKADAQVLRLGLQERRRDRQGLDYVPIPPSVYKLVEKLWET